MLDLYGRGEPADAVTVSAELERRGELRRIGGAPYLHTLIATVPTAANAGYYAEIVAEKAILRRLVEAGTRIVQLGYAGAEGADVDDIVDRAQAEIYEVTERRDQRGLRRRSRSCCSRRWTRSTPSPRAAASSLGVPTGFADLDDGHQRPAPRPDDHRRGPARDREVHAGAGLRPVGSVKHGLTSVIFSLEMSRTEIVMRLLSAEAQDPAGRHARRAG